MKIETYCGGAAQTNAYLVSNNGNAFLVDAPDGAADWLEGRIAKEKIKLAGLLLTHGHWDHIVDAAAIQERLKIPVFIHRDCAILLENAEIQAPFCPVPGLRSCKVDRILKDEKTLKLDGFEMELLLCPGHCPGSLCFYFSEEKKLFDGDVLFEGSVGRWDLPGGSQQELMESIAENILVLPDDTEVYPGHGPSTSVGKERRSNPYLKPDFSR